MYFNIVLLNFFSIYDLNIKILVQLLFFTFLKKKIKNMNVSKYLKIFLNNMHFLHVNLRVRFIFKT